MSTSLAFINILEYKLFKNKLFWYCTNQIFRYVFKLFWMACGRDATVKLSTMLTHLSINCPYKDCFPRNTNILAETTLRQYWKNIEIHFVRLTHSNIVKTLVPNFNKNEKKKNNNKKKTILPSHFFTFLPHCMRRHIKVWETY